MQLITKYGEEAYYVLQEGDLSFLVHENERGQTREEMDTEALKEKALALLNDDPRVTHDDVYLAEEDLETYFSEVEPLQDIPGCYTGKHSQRKFAILSRYLVEDGPLDKDYYYPLLVAQIYPQEDEKDFLLLLKEMAEKA